MGAPRATMVGRAAGVDVLGAAFLNAASGNALDFDDTDPQTLIHPGAAMFGALLSVAEDRRLSGADVLTAFVVGTEIAFRLGRALGPRHYARGWHITVTCGTVGAAAAVGNLIGLDAEQMRNAIGISATQSSGIIENLGAEAKSVGVGGAARKRDQCGLLGAGRSPQRPLLPWRARAASSTSSPPTRILTSRCRGWASNGRFSQSREALSLLPAHAAAGGRSTRIEGASPWTRRGSRE